MRWLSCFVVSLSLCACGGDDEAACASPADCDEGEVCVNSTCVPGTDGGTRDANEDASNDDASRDVGNTDAPMDALVDAPMDVADAPDPDVPVDAGPACPPPAGPRADPIVLYTFEAPDDATRITDRAPAAPDVPLVDNMGLFTIDNASGGSVLFAAGRLAAELAASNELVTVIRATGSFSVEAWARPENLVLEDEGSPPERLVTLGFDSGNQAFVMGQDLAEVQARTRTDTTGPTGHTCAEPDPAPIGSIYGTGLDTVTPHHIVMVFDSALGQPRLWVDGVRFGDDWPCRVGALNWLSDTYRLAIGDEISGNRNWEGVLHRVAIYARPMQEDEIDCRFAAGPNARVF